MLCEKKGMAKNVSRYWLINIYSLNPPKLNLCIEQKTVAKVEST